MTDFDKKAWLDEHVMPVLKQHQLSLYHPFWNMQGARASEVLIVCLAEPESEDAWAGAAKALVDAGWRFDYLREQILVVMDTGETVKLFGGDGAPLFNEEGVAALRLFRKLDDGVNLVLQVGCRYPKGLAAAAATRAFYAQFEESPLEVCQKYGAVFGAA